MDVDVKGGGAISIAHATSTPVIFFGIGQGYDDLEEFSADKILGRVF